jgi:hypothetical protein
MHFIMVILVMSSFVMASEKMNLECFNQEHEKVLTISGLGKMNGKIINIYDNREEFNQTINDKKYKTTYLYL